MAYLELCLLVRLTQTVHIILSMMNRVYHFYFKYLVPVAQSIVSLTSSLRVISLTVLTDSIHNILIFFAEKMWVAFALQKLLTFFQHICISLDVNFNESLTNDVVSFEQLGPDNLISYHSFTKMWLRKSPKISTLYSVLFLPKFFF